MKKLIIPIVAILLAVGSSAFTAKRTTSNFFEYQGPDFSKTSIQTSGNYIAVDSEDQCDDTNNVCGVILETPKTLGQNPDSGQFSDKQDALWDSESNHTGPTDAAVLMKP
jgi:hypothetical protein